MSRVMIKERGLGEVIADGIVGENVHEIENGWYFSPFAVDTTHLKVTERIYTCPYKGVCYWVDLETPELHAQNVAWIYFEPKRGYEHIAGHIAFDRRGSTATQALVAEVA